MPTVRAAITTATSTAFLIIGLPPVEKDIVRKLSLKEAAVLSAELHALGKSGRNLRPNPGCVKQVLKAEGRTGPRRPARSEDHTSELQSQSNLVCRLLLEKK